MTAIQSCDGWRVHNRNANGDYYVRRSDGAIVPVNVVSTWPFSPETWKVVAIWEIRPFGYRRFVGNWRKVFDAIANGTESATFKNGKSRWMIGDLDHNHYRIQSSPGFITITKFNRKGEA